MVGGYVVAIKPSARRINEAAGRWVAREGSRRIFSDRDAARAWADAIDEDDGAVRIQNAAPNDPAPVDGYLVADPARRPRRTEGARTASAELDAYDGDR